MFAAGVEKPRVEFQLQGEEPRLSVDVRRDPVVGFAGIREIFRHGKAAVYEYVFDFAVQVFVAFDVFAAVYKRIYVGGAERGQFVQVYEISDAVFRHVRRQRFFIR